MDQSDVDTAMTVLNIAEEISGQDLEAARDAVWQNRIAIRATEHAE